MKILIAFDAGFKSNPFVQELADGLASSGASVTVSLEEFWSQRNRYDIVHLQWPEMLFWKNRITEQDIRTIANAVSSWRQTSRVVLTRHNIYPHLQNDNFAKDLYHRVFQCLDGMIHLGQRSVEDFKNRYGDRWPMAHTVIRHHIYPSYTDRSLDKNHCRRILRNPGEKPIILVFGVIRNSDERELILSLNEAFADAIHLIVPKWRVFQKSRKRHPIQWIWSEMSFQLEKSRATFAMGNRFVVQKRTDILFNAADLVFIPRAKSLNSGIVSQSFGYGRVAVGPNVHNIGEQLQVAGNPTFEAQDKEMMVKQVGVGLKLAAADKGDENLQYALDCLSPSEVAVQHIRFYESL